MAVLFDNLTNTTSAFNDDISFFETNTTAWSVQGVASSRFRTPFHVGMIGAAGILPGMNVESMVKAAVHDAQKIGRVDPAKYGDELTRLDHCLREYLRASRIRREALRGQIQDLLNNSKSPTSCVNKVLELCADIRVPDSLDNGFAWIAIMGERALPYAEQLLHRDRDRWTEESIHHFSTEDHWYMLLRGMAHGKVSEDKLWPYITACLASGFRGIRDAAVNAAYDLNTSHAKVLLENLAEADRDPFIRKSAAELVADME